VIAMVDIIRKRAWDGVWQISVNLRNRSVRHCGFAVALVQASP
jgi:hypothetical protein